MFLFLYLKEFNVKFVAKIVANVSTALGNIHVLRKHKGGRGGGQKLTILLSKKLTKRGGGGSKKPKTRLRNTWMFP